MFLLSQLLFEVASFVSIIMKMNLLAIFWKNYDRIIDFDYFGFWSLKNMEGKLSSNFPIKLISKKPQKRLKVKPMHHSCIFKTLACTNKLVTR